MADRKITELSAMSAGGQATGDLLTIVDVSEAAAADKNKKITMENLFKGIPGNVGIGTTSPSDNLTVAGSSGAVNLGITANTANAYDSPSLKFLGGNLSTSSILFGDASDADIGKIIYNHDGNSLAFTVNASERLRISSSGDVGIGTSSPTQKLHVQAGYLLLNSSQSNGSGDARLLINQGSRQYTLYPFSSDSNSTVDLRLSAPGASNQVTITDAGNVGIGTTSPDSNLHVAGNGSTQSRLECTGGNNVYQRFENTDNARGYVGYEGKRLVFWADNGSNTGDVRVAFMDADGLKFNGDTAAANALDDYEEGTFNLRLNNQNDDATFTFSGNQGYYVKIGSEVHFQVYMFGITCTNTGTSTNSRLYGLPFNAGNNSNQYAPCLIMHNNALSNTTAGYVNINSSFIVPLQRDGNSIALITTMSNKSMMVAGSYRTV